MTQYKTGRLIATAVVVFGWLIVAIAICAGLLVAASAITGFTGLRHVGVALIPSLVAITLSGMALALFGYVSGAVFDMADSSRSSTGA